MPSRSKRKYAYQRIAPGLVLQPGNDGVTMFAIGRYADGPSLGLTDEPRDFEAWGWGRVPPDAMARIIVQSKHDPEAAIEALREWGSDNRWPRHKTMRAAIEDALVHEGAH